MPGSDLVPCFALVRASSSAPRAWTWRWMSAGFRGLFSRFSAAFTPGRTVPSSARMCRNGVSGRLYTLLIFAPVRVFWTSFCWGPKWLVRRPCSAQIRFSSSHSAAVS